MSFDYKKEYKEFYLPPSKPCIVDLPAMQYVAVRGKGDPNTQNGEYKRSIELLYSMAYTIKMSKKSNHRMEGYFDFVVPPLEGFWWQENANDFDPERKQDLRFISCIRLPDFVTLDDFEWARAEAARKKKLDMSLVELMDICEGRCVQCMHIGPYDSEPATVQQMHAYATEHGYEPDFSETRLHYEIYLSDMRKVTPDKQRTVVRHPIRAV